MKMIAIVAALIALPFAAVARPHGGWPTEDEWRRIDVRYFHGRSTVRHVQRYRAKAKRLVRRIKSKERYAPKLMHSKVAKAASRKTFTSHRIDVQRSVNLAHVIGPLASKAAQIVEVCGSRVISAYRPGARVRGSGQPSLHGQYPSRAVDLAGNPACIRRHLVGWPGGQSTDYARVGHYHVSYAPGSGEWGTRFAHYQPRKRTRARYAVRHRYRS